MPRYPFLPRIVLCEGVRIFQWANSCRRQTRAGRALKRGQAGLFPMSLSSSKPIPHSLTHCRVLLDRDRSVLTWTTSIVDVLGVGRGHSLSFESTPVKDNVCQCVTKQHKHSYSILPSVGFVIWGGGSRYLGMCIQPEESASVLYPFIQKMNNKKSTTCKHRGNGKSHIQPYFCALFGKCWSLHLIKNNFPQATAIQID